MRAVDQRSRAVCIDPVAVHPQQVAGWTGDDLGPLRSAAEELAQPGDVAVDDGAGAGRRLLVPQRFDQPIHRDDLVRFQQQAGQQSANRGAAQRLGKAVDTHFEGPEQAELEPRARCLDRVLPRHHLQNSTFAHILLSLQTVSAKAHTESTPWAAHAATSPAPRTGHTVTIIRRKWMYPWPPVHPNGAMPDSCSDVPLRPVLAVNTSRGADTPSKVGTQPITRTRTLWKESPTCAHAVHSGR